MEHKLVEDLQGDTIVTRDGEIGTLSDAYFDDEGWTLRYLVIDTGRWLPGRNVLVSPGAMAQANEGVLQLEMTRDEIERAPGIDADPPVSRLLQTARQHYYTYPYAGPYLWAMMPPAAAPADPALYSDPVRREAQREARARAAQTHLRSSAEVVGYRIRAADGEIGHVEDFIVDDADWTIRAMVVDTRNWLPGKKVLGRPDSIRDIDWDERRVTVSLRRD
jgi:sporulation protein YlmC with PRC-barrel domain